MRGDRDELVRVTVRRGSNRRDPPVITVVLKGREMTLRAIRSLGWDLPWIVYDQCTDPGVLDFVGEMSDVEVIRPSRRSSVATAWNRSLERAWSRGADRALVINNDIVFLPHAYEAVLEVSEERPEVGFVSMAELPEDFHHFREQVTVPYTRFSAFLIRRSMWEQVGRFDTQFRPAYWEDADYLRRIRAADVPIALTARAACFHAHFGSTQGLLGRIRRDLYYRMNRHRFVRKWGDDRRS